MVFMCFYGNRGIVPYSVPSPNIPHHSPTVETPLRSRPVSVKDVERALPGGADHFR